MSDRTPASVRSGPSSGDGAASKDSAQGASAPVSATQSISATAAQRAQSTQASSAGGRATAPATEATPGASPATASEGSPSQGRPAERPAGRTGQRPAKSGRGPRRARLQLRHIDTWSALKISLVLSIALFFIWMVAVGILYMVLNSLGVFATLNDLFGQVGSVSGNAGTGDVITPGVVFGGAAFIGAINIVLMTALCTVGTFIYNLCSDLVGGLEITLSERD